MLTYVEDQTGRGHLCKAQENEHKIVNQASLGNKIELGTESVEMWKSKFLFYCQFIWKFVGILFFPLKPLSVHLQSW